MSQHTASAEQLELLAYTEEIGGDCELLRRDLERTIRELLTPAPLAPAPLAPRHRAEPPNGVVGYRVQADGDRTTTTAHTTTTAGGHSTPVPSPPSESPLYPVPSPGLSESGAAGAGYRVQGTGPSESSTPARDAAAAHVEVARDY